MLILELHGRDIPIGSTPTSVDAGAAPMHLLEVVAELFAAVLPETHVPVFHPGAEVSAFNTTKTASPGLRGTP